MTTTETQAAPTAGDELAPPAAGRATARAISWIRASVLLTVLNAIVFAFGWDVSFIFGMTWAHPLEDLIWDSAGTLPALVAGIALALPMLWVTGRARTETRMMTLATGFFALGALVALAVYSDPISAAGQAFIAYLAIRARGEQRHLVPQAAPGQPPLPY